MSTRLFALPGERRGQLVVSIDHAQLDVSEGDEVIEQVSDHLPERQRPWVKAILQRAHRRDDTAAAKRLLQDLARRLERDYPSAAESVREASTKRSPSSDSGCRQRPVDRSARPTPLRVSSAEPAM